MLRVALAYTEPSPSLTHAAPFPTDEVREPQRRRFAAEIGDTARCPCCHAPLVARMGCRGPYFFCLCVESPFRAQG